jgi:transposase
MADVAIRSRQDGCELDSHDVEQPAPNGSRSRKWTADEKLDIVLQSFSGAQSNIEICRRYHISEPTLYKWRSVVIEAGRAYLEGRRGASIRALREENQRLKQLLGELSLRMRLTVLSNRRNRGN